MSLEQAVHRLEQAGVAHPTCAFCATDPATLRLESCGHAYCSDCLAACLRSSLGDSAYPRCTHQGCCARFVEGDAEVALQLVAELESVAAAEQLQARYYRVSVLAALQAAGAQRVECLHCGLELSLDAGHALPASYRCRGCGQQPQVSTAASDAEYLQINAVCCSGAGCGIHIQKDGGCNHLTCTRCGAHTCWACGQALESGQRHAAGGACSGRRPDAAG